MAFPLVSLQYNELYIDIEMRPVNELFVVRDILSSQPVSIAKYIQANQNDTLFQFYRFLQPPPTTALLPSDYTDMRTNWAADVHLVSTYAFLSDEEVKVFASQQQQYLIKEVYSYNYENVTGSKRVKLDSLGMVANWMWFYQRSDAYLRNEWSNYSNWPYDYLPYDVIDPNGEMPYDVPGGGCGPFTPNENPDNSSTGIKITGTYNVANEKNIMQKWALLLDGKYRENQFDAGVFNYVEKYSRSPGNAPDGLYCYNFCLNTNPYEFQPNGAMNLSKFNLIEFEFTTYAPPLDPSAQVLTICDTVTGLPIGVNKPTWRIYDYNYNLVVFEERYNVLTFTSGNAALMYAR